MQLEELKKKFEDAKVSPIWDGNTFKMQQGDKKCLLDVKGKLTRDGRAIIMRCGGTNRKAMKQKIKQIIGS